MAAEDVAGAMAAALEANAAYAALVPSGSWAQAVPEELVLPFVALLDRGTVTHFTSEVAYVEETLTEIRCYAAAAAAAGGANPAQAIGLAAKAALDAQGLTLSVTGMTFVGIIRQSGPVLTLDPKRSSADERVYVSTLRYKTWMQGLRPKAG